LEESDWQLPITALIKKSARPLVNQEALIEVALIEQDTLIFLFILIKTSYLCGKFLLMFFRRAAAFLLLLVFFAQAFSRYLLVADYYVNSSSYLADCVNKDRPWMHCNGRCQLCKKLHQQAGGEDKQSPERRSGNNGDEPLYSTASLGDFNALHILALIKLQYTELSAGKPIGMPRDLFHPPGDRLA
jgi:hypothetical protein